VCTLILDSFDTTDWFGLVARLGQDDGIALFTNHSYKGVFAQRREKVH
jgi:hypothetical protein